MAHNQAKVPAENPTKVRCLTDPQIEKLKNYLKMPRYVFKQNLSEYFLFSDELTLLACVSTDISKFGISLVTRMQLAPNMTFLFKLPKQEKTIKLAVIWCEPNQFNSEIYHSGLELCDHNENLMLMCVKEGLLKKKQESPDQGKVPIDYYKIQESLSKLHAYDKGLLAKVGYKTLVHTHTSYSIRIENQSFVVVMPSNMQAQEFMKLDSYEAAKKTFIVAEEALDFARKQWVKVWPGYGLINERIGAELRKPKENILPELRSVKKEEYTMVSSDDDIVSSDDDQDIEFEVEDC
ncbi:MAG: hypothetical protein AB8G05_06935 [Oligoflexales bacterium]